MNLAISNLHKITASDAVSVPQDDLLALPEKVLQFGTGVLLRGLPDFVINKANQQGLFNGRIVVVKSTSTGGTDAFETQNCLYTVCIRGIEDGSKIEENQIVSSISRVLNAATDWEEVLLCAANPALELVISNTTELGITLVKDNAHASPPVSFPGKLLAFLYRRFKVFNGDADKGLVVVPTELIPGNADKLLAIVLELAHQNGFEIAFIDWLENANHFCNSLVDRIVPGKFNAADQARVQAELGYEDELMIMSEKYGLWAIQSANEKVHRVLSFAAADGTTVIAPDITKFRELKLRLLNGSHTFSCSLAWLAGFKTVKEAMADEIFSGYISQLMKEAIVPSIESENLPAVEAQQFAAAVLDRYRNPYIDHQWASICTQSSSKMVTRNLDLLRSYANRFGQASQLMSLGLAAHILYMKATPDADGNYYGNAQGNRYLVTDQHAAIFSDAWKAGTNSDVVNTIFKNEELWGADLAEVAGLEEAVNSWLNLLQQEGAKVAMEKAIQEKILIDEK